MKLADESVGMKIDMSSKLARQIAFKKKLEEEYKRNKNKYVREETDNAEENDLENTKIKMKEDEKRMEENEEKKGNWLKKREEYTVRAAKFSEMKMKRLEEKKRIEDQTTILEDPNIWSELECIIKDNQMVVKGLEKDSCFVPICELEYDKDTKLGQGKFGSVYSGTSPWLLRY